MIDDRVEDGMSEACAVAQIGDVDEIIAQIIADCPLSKLIKERVSRKRSLKVWEIILLVLGSPIWLTLLLSAFIVVIALYVVLWAGVISLWAGFVSLIAVSAYGIVAGIIYAFGEFAHTGTFMIGVAIFAMGAGIFMFYGCKCATKGVWLIAKKALLKTKKSLVKKEREL
jgi:uncharacterized membrane protein